MPILPCLPLKGCRLLVRFVVCCCAFVLLAVGVGADASLLRQTATDAVVVDSRMTREEALRNTSFPLDIIEAQEVAVVRYYSFDGKLHEGQIVVHRELKDDIIAIFRDIEQSRFPIAKVVPIVRYGWSDDKSIADNNTAGFNYRTVEGTGRLSDHARGRAVDINPYLNPWVRRNGKGSRPYNPAVAGTITAGDAVVNAFAKRGWAWGGSWKNSKDYQHFYKR